ncbi:glycosyl transferase [Kitasatospora sp. NPDC058965]|uniref:glycosyl transferase n=1 Tax=Kitasatospora sp. NPDC058965 TaxID=3346682 RepID=UPI0036A4D7D7
MPEILFLTRGHGFGHAARDLRVIRELRRRPGVTVRVLASGSALTYYRMRGVDCLPVAIPDEDDLGPGAAQALWRALAGLPRPDLVVSDEVPAALPFAERVWRRPCVLLLCALNAEWGRPEADRYLDGAAEVLVLDFPQTRAPHYGTRAPLDFLGPVVERYAVGRADARRRLGLAERTEVGVLALGGMTGRPESRRMAAAALRAWRAHARPGARLLVLAEPDPSLDDGGPGGGEVVWAGVSAEPELYYRAADVVLNDAMGSNLCELAWNGVPAVALLDGASAAEAPRTFHERVRLLARERLIEAAAVEDGPAAVWQAVERARAGAARPDAREGFGWSSGGAVADRLLDALDRALGPAGAPRP